MIAAGGRPRSALRRADFLRATRQGRRHVTPRFLVFTLDRPPGAAARLGITVTRKVGNAVRRNRIKRLVREWFRSCREDLRAIDVVVVARRDLPAKLTLDSVASDLCRAIERLGGSSGRSTDTGATCRPGSETPADSTLPAPSTRPR
ncbi:MAG: ribonuclease P protein component [Myxococcota bacterium]